MKLNMVLQLPMTWSTEQYIQQQVHLASYQYQLAHNETKHTRTVPTQQPVPLVFLFILMYVWSLPKGTHTRLYMRTNAHENQ